MDYVWRNAPGTWKGQETRSEWGEAVHDPISDGFQYLTERSRRLRTNRASEVTYGLLRAGTPSFSSPAL
ncbi:protein of unknown function (plasmid) [Cupriavidus neocaledonicus]|uniref:Uncharacterized protein n=1 Tax=Cupriavidus neocaledonicus TaxID=1040979 RepID=A0A375HVF2_9BURK|nr:hypothetical protein CBM2605_B60034 [Cupriavidus neocaledonicus]SPD60670.1 protein of unknown function [Cupriavidus neocaledonicus]